MGYDFERQGAVDSVHIVPKDDDPFFNPALLGFTGFGFDGLQYVAGVRNANVLASWYSELPSATRGPLQSFPVEAVALLSSVSLAILDVGGETPVLWMLFYLDDSLAFALNPLGGLNSATLAGINYAGGVVSILEIPDAGSSSQASQVLEIDFGQDQARVWTAIPAA